MLIISRERGLIPGKSLVVHVALGFLALLLLAMLASAPAQAQTFNVIYNFTGGTDGSVPSTDLAMDAAGNLYGTTFQGGIGFGGVYELSPAGSGWTIQTLYNFKGNATGDGGGPDGISLGPNGALFGVTEGGGNHGCFGIVIYDGCGTVFELSGPPDRKEEVLYRFTGRADGLDPYGIGPLTFDQDSIYGTVLLGGTTGFCIFGYTCGGVFKLTPSDSGWSEGVIWNFGSGSDGAQPASSVILGRSANLYGATLAGGAGNGCGVQGHNGCGTIYQLSPPVSRYSGWTQTVLYNFQGGTDGGAPYSGVIADPSGNLYGATSYGGSGGGGTVFELSPSAGGWTFTLLYSFAGSGAGANDQCPSCPGPHVSLITDGAGNIYGTTFNDGAYGHGSAFRLTRSGSTWLYTDLHDFTGGSDGGNIWSPLLLDSSGNLYGAATVGGANGDGVVFQITP